MSPSKQMEECTSVDRTEKSEKEIHIFITQPLKKMLF